MSDECPCEQCDPNAPLTTEDRSHLAKWWRELVDRYQRQSYELEPPDPTEADLAGFDHAANPTERDCE